jgi:toxin secretion/phage lysis holin
MAWAIDIIVTTLHNSHIFVAIIYASFIDIFLGIIKAVVSKSLNSTISAYGLLKHCLLILIPPLTVPIFFALEYGDYWSVFETLVLFTQALSLAENWIALGLPFPEAIAKYLDNEKRTS